MTFKIPGIVSVWPVTGFLTTAAIPTDLPTLNFEIKPAEITFPPTNPLSIPVTSTLRTLYSPRLIGESGPKPAVIFAPVDFEIPAVNIFAGGKFLTL